MPEVPEDDLCWAGHKAFMRGKWIVPCPNFGNHVIGVPEGPLAPIRLCETHFQQALVAGLIDEPYMSEEGFAERERRRKGRLGN